MASRAPSVALSLPPSDDDDDLVILQVEPAPNNRSSSDGNTIESLLRPRPRLVDPVRSITPAQRREAEREARRDSRRSERRQVNLPPVRSIHHDLDALILPGQPAPTPGVIDLTDEPDSPVQTRPQLPLPPLPPLQNPRRTSSQRASPPRLSRTDGSTFGAPIDLTDDSPDDNWSATFPRGGPSGSNTFSNRPHHHHHHHHHRNNGNPHPHPHLFPPPRLGRFPAGLPDELISFEIMNSTAGRLTRNFGRHLVSMFENMDAMRAGVFTSPQLNVSLNAFQHAGPGGSSEGPKPPIEAVPEPRDGFTRDTCAEEPSEDAAAGEEMVVVCPACSEELAYDPTGAAPQASTGKKRKRAPGEHHFWALKKCGHVYCADCFENRRPTKANPNGVGFRAPDGRALLAAPSDTRCAVPDCDTKVIQKAEWVGIFL
jgi:hypothetical protein